MSEEDWLLPARPKQDLSLDCHFERLYGQVDPEEEDQQVLGHEGNGLMLEVVEFLHGVLEVHDPPLHAGHHWWRDQALGLSLEQLLHGPGKALPVAGRALCPVALYHLQLQGREQAVLFVEGIENVLHVIARIESYIAKTLSREHVVHDPPRHGLLLVASPEEPTKEKRHVVDAGHETHCLAGGQKEARDAGVHVEADHERQEHAQCVQAAERSQVDSSQILVPREEPSCYVDDERYEKIPAEEDRRHDRAGDHLEEAPCPFARIDAQKHSSVLVQMLNLLVSEVLHGGLHKDGSGMTSKQTA
mmetsp:Transcript_10845/g.24532  ORF Transcript_10845/g.24532 Transcript_10845/m.24532 type:complete len:303 (-) Transcript_10845:7-915(-)